jgi:hypothetical protein
MNAIREVINRLLSLHPLRLLLLFLLFDVIALGLHELWVQGVLESRVFRISRDRGVGETIHYAKFIFVVIMLVKWRALRPAQVFTAWVLLFIVILVDDSIGIHEVVGRWVEAVWPFPEIEGVRTKDLAEIVSLALFEGSVLLYVAWQTIKAPPDIRRFSILLFLALCSLIVGSIVLDIFAHNIVEDLGEMAAASFFLVFMHYQYRRHVEPAMQASQRSLQN